MGERRLVGAARRLVRTATAFAGGGSRRAASRSASVYRAVHPLRARPRAAARGRRGRRLARARVSRPRRRAHLPPEGRRAGRRRPPARRGSRPTVGLYPDSRPDPLGDYHGVARARRSSSRRGSRSPGTASPIADPAGRAREIVEHHRDRLDETAAALGGRAAQRATRSRSSSSATSLDASAAPLRRRGDALAPGTARRTRVGPRAPVTTETSPILRRRSGWTTKSFLDVRPTGRRRDPLPRTARRRGAHPAERLLRRGRVRARDRAPDAHPGARAARATGGRAPCSRSSRTRRASSPRCSSASPSPRLAIGALGEQALAQVFDPIFATVIAVVARLPDHHLPPRRDRRARAEGGRARARGDDRARGLGSRCAAFFVVIEAADLGAAALERRDPALARPRRRPGARWSVYSEAELKMLLARSTEEGELEQAGAGDALQGLRLRRQGGLGR